MATQVVFQQPAKPTAARLPTSKSPSLAAPRHLFENLRHQVDQLFEDSSPSALHLPFTRWAFDVEPF
jgi:hypothetical protein